MQNKNVRSVVSVCLSLVLAGAGVAYGQSPPLQKPKELEGFHVVLLAAHTQAEKWMPELPAGAMKALRDAGEVLPYKGYVLVDQGFVKGSAGREQRIALQYPGHEYSAGVKAGGTQAGDASVALTITLHEMVSTASESKGLELLSASFSALVGETVVVGTSRVRGTEQALVMLVTLLPARGARGK